MPASKNGDKSMAKLLGEFVTLKTEICHAVILLCRRCRENNVICGAAMQCRQSGQHDKSLFSVYT